MTKPIDYIVWKLMPLEERIATLRNGTTSGWIRR